MLLNSFPTVGERDIDAMPKKKEGLVRYLSCLSYNHIHFSVSEHILFGAQVPALKPGSTETDRGSEKKKWGFWGFFLEVTYQKSLKPNLFRKVSCEKPKIGTLVTTEFGGLVSELHRDMPGSCFHIRRRHVPDNNCTFWPQQ